PSRNSRVKQSCRLLKSVCLASLRSRSEKSRQTRRLKSRIRGCSTLLNQPANRVSQRLGMRLVSRKLILSCCTMRAIDFFRWADGGFMGLSFNCNTVAAEEKHEPHNHSVHTGGAGRGLPVAEVENAPGAVARQASLARRACSHVPAHGTPGTVLRI